MANLVDWIKGAAEGEPIEAVVIGTLGASYYKPGQNPSPVLTWEQAAPLLNKTFDAGYGAAGCEAIYAWTASRVIFVSQYDGATRIEAIPRHPVPCLPTMPGG